AESPGRAARLAPGRSRSGGTARTAGGGSMAGGTCSAIAAAGRGSGCAGSTARVPRSTGPMRRVRRSYARRRGDSANRSRCPATARSGEPLQWPAQFYTQPDRAGVLASSAADVVELADDDRAARAILTRAAAHAAASLSAAAQGGVPSVLSAAGGLARSERFLHQIRSELAGLRPDAELRPARGTSLDGALELAGRAAAGKAQGAAPYLWVS